MIKMSVHRSFRLSSFVGKKINYSQISLSYCIYHRLFSNYTNYNPTIKDGRVALITGGAAGIGLEICRTFARDLKARVVIADLNEKLAKEAANELINCGFKAIGVGCD